MPKIRDDNDILSYIRDGQEDPLAYALRILNDPGASEARRDRMCILLIPYFCQPIRYVGKKTQRQELAVNIDDDMFRSRPIPTKQTPAPADSMYTSRRRAPMMGSNDILSHLT